MIIKTGIMASILLSAAASPSAPANAAEAVLIRGDGTEMGRAHFEAAPGGVLMKLHARGLSPGAHGLHLHGVGRCTGPDFLSAGPHWNPTGRRHGLKAPDGAHMGDLPNLDVGADGKGRIETLIRGATLDSGANGLRDADGTAVVIHASADDNMTDPSGESGGREYCGVVKPR